MIKNFTKIEENSEAEEIIYIALKFVSIGFLAEFEEKILNAIVNDNKDILFIDNIQFVDGLILNSKKNEDNEEAIFLTPNQKDMFLSNIKVLQNKLSS